MANRVARQLNGAVGFISRLDGNRPTRVSGSGKNAVKAFERSLRHSCPTARASNCGSRFVTKFAIAQLIYSRVSLAHSLFPSNELKLSRGYLRARFRCSERILITFGQVNKPGSRRLQRLVR